MSSLTKISAADAKLRSDKGAILFIVAASLVVLLGFMGLAIDLGHAYNNKSQLQNMADACALAGGEALNGTPEGIDLATSRARDQLGRLANKTEFNNQGVTIPEANIGFSSSLNGPWNDRATARTAPTTVKYVRVIVPPQDSEVFFARVIPVIPAVLSFGAEAVAGKLPQDEICSGLDPFSPVARDLTNANGHWGFEVGQVYALRNDPNGEGAPTADGTPGGGQTDGTCQGTPGTGHLGQCQACNSAPGQGGEGQVEPDQVCDSLGAYYGGQTGNFGLSDPSNGGPSTRCYKDVIINGSRSNCVRIGAGTLPTDPGNGGRPVEAALQERYCQDSVQDRNITKAQYDILKQTNPGPNRRVLRVSFNDGVPNGHSTYNVMGFGCFFMPKCPNVHPNSSAICLVYIGRCDGDGNEDPVGNGNGASITRLVLFK
jgi:Flp pilus assembly protein TadG